MKKSICTITFIFSILIFNFCKAQNIYTVAGTGVAGYFGDGGAATSAKLYTPASVNFGNTPGFYFIGDEQNNVIRMVNINSGIITTVAGTGVGGYNGDGVPATSAEMNWTIDVAIDTAGNLYISELNGERIRKVNKKTGIITTFVGTGSAGFSGDGGAANIAKINNPRFLVVDDSDNLFFADQANNRIRKVNLQTNVITTVVGTGTPGYAGDGNPAINAKLNSPYGITFDSHYNMFIGDQGNYCVREVNRATGIITTVAGIGGVSGSSGDGGPAISAKLSAATSLTVGLTGNLYIADTYNHKVREVINNTGIINTIAGTGVGGYNGDGISALSAELYFPNGVMLDSCGSLYIADWGNNRVREVIAQDNPITITGKTPICEGTQDTLVVSGGGTYKWSNGATTSSIIVSLASTTTYSIAISNDCSNSVRDTTIKITVKPLSVSIAAGKDTVCAGNPTTITAIGGGTYKWSNGSTSNKINVSPFTDTTYSVIVTNNGCSRDTNMQIKVNPIPSVILLGNNTVCAGDTTILYAKGGGSYKWSNGSTSDSTLVHPLTNTTYSLTVTNNKGCSKDTIIKVIATPLPSVSFAGKRNLCIGDSTTLYVSGGGTYKWSNGSTSSSLTVSPFVNTIYTLAVSNNGCVKDTSINVTVSLPPSISLSGKNSICAGDSATLSASGGDSYKWSNGSTTSSITIGPNTTTSYSVIVSKGGCPKDTSILIKVSPLPTTITGPLSICRGDSVTLYSSGGGTYKWNTGSSTSTISVIPLSTTTYSVTIKNGLCIKDTDVTVTVNPTPIAKITGKNQLCKGDSVVLIATGGGTYLWNTGQTSTSILVTPSSTTVYTIIVSNSFGCKADTTFEVNVNLPDGIISGPGSLCPGDSIILTASGGGTYLWNTGATNSSITIHQVQNATYSVIVNNGCVDTVTKSVFVDSPQLYACCDTTVTNPGIPVILDASGTVKYYWTPSTGVSCDSCPNPIVTPTVTTTYTVIGTDSAGCLISRTITVDVLPEGCLIPFIPNVFTPNGDGINNEFVIDAQYVLGYSIIIYDRWGKEMYQSNNPDVYWDGKNQNNHDLVSAGVYYYIIKYSCNNKSYNKDGYVQVIR